MNHDIKKVILSILEYLPDDSTREEITRELKLRLENEDELINELDKFMSHTNTQMLLRNHL